MALNTKTHDRQNQYSLWQKVRNFIMGKNPQRIPDSTLQGKRYFFGATNYYVSSLGRKLAERNVTQNAETSSSIPSLDAAMTIIKIHAAIRQAGTLDALIKIESFIEGDNALEESNRSALREALNRRKQHIEMSNV